MAQRCVVQDGHVRDGGVPATATRLGGRTRAAVARRGQAPPGQGRGGCLRVRAHNGNLRPENRAGAPLSELLGPAEQGPERLLTRIRARRRQARQSVERIHSAAATLRGLVSAVPVADRGEPAGEPEQVGRDRREPLGDGVGKPRMSRRHEGISRVGSLALAKGFEELDGQVTPHEMPRQDRKEGSSRVFNNFTLTGHVRPAGEHRVTMELISRSSANDGPAVKAERDEDTPVEITAVVY